MLCVYVICVYMLFYLFVELLAKILAFLWIQKVKRFRLQEKICVPDNAPIQTCG